MGHFKTFKSIFLISSLFTSPLALAKKAAVIQGYDAIVAPGSTVSLEVKVERARFFPTRVDLRKEKVVFTKDGYGLGVAKSKKDGLAKIEAVFYEPGVHIVKAKLDESSKYEANVTDNRVLVVDPDAPLLVTDIDHTLADISGREFVRTADRKIPELPGAAEVVNRLSKNFSVFYMTARDDAFIKRTKFWLDYMNFPKGPSFFWDFGPFNGVPYNHGKYKTGVIKRLKETHPNIQVGVGDKPHDVEAYRKNGLRSYYIGLSGEVLPEHTIVVKTWSEIEKHLADNPVGTLPGDPQ